MAVFRLLVVFIALTLREKQCEAAITFSLTSTVDSVTLTWTLEDGHGYSNFTITVGGIQHGGVHPGTEFDASSTTTSEIIPGLASGTAYTIVVSDDDSEIWNKNIYTKPATSTVLETANVGTTSLTLTWTAGSCSTAQTFTVRDGENTVPAGGDTVTGNSTSLTGLTPGQQYTFTVTAMCGGETSAASDTITESMYPAAVATFTELSSTLDTVTLKWTPGDGVRESYTIRWGDSEKVTGITGDLTSTIIPGLTPQATNTFNIVAVSNTKESTEKTVVVTLPNLPLVQNFDVESVTDDSVTLTWTDVGTSEAIQYEVTSADSGTSVTHSQGTTTKTFTGLSPGQSYQFTIAVLLGGVTGNTVPTSSYTNPEAPTSLVTANVGTDSLTLTWTAGGCGTDQTFTVRDGGNTVPTGGDTVTGSLASLTSLTPGQQYTFTVTAECGGKMSAASEAITESMNPAPVTSFTESSTLNTVTLGWTHGNGVRDTYTISGGDGVNEKIENIGSTVTSRTIEGLTPGMAYTFRIIAISNKKESTEVTVSVTLTDLPTVQDFVVASVTESTVTLTWTAVDSVEEIMYTVTRTQSGSGASTSATLDKDIPTHEFTGLAAGQEYVFSIAVVLNGETGSAENVTDNTTPSAPTSVTVLPLSTTEVTVGWTSSSKYTYSVTYKKMDSNEDPLSTSCITVNCQIDVFSAGDPGTDITVYVTATLGTRTSAPGTTDGHTKPPPPGLIALTSRTTTSVTVTWAEGDAGVYDKYKVSVIDPSTGNPAAGLGEMEIDDEADRTASLSPLIPGRVYRVNVVTVKGTTESEAATGLFRSNPKPATDPVLTSRNTNSLSVSWTKPDEGEVTKYIVQLSGIANSEQKVATTSATFPNLIPGTLHTVVVTVQSGDDDDTATQATAAKTTSTEVKTDEYTEPNPPSLNEPVSSVDSVTVTWTAPTEGDLTGYKLRLYKSDDTPVSGEKTVLKSVDKNVVFGSSDSVESGTIYTVKIYSYVDDDGDEIKSSDASEQVTTVPKPPSTVDIEVGKTTSRAVISWTEPSQTAAVDGYRVKLEFDEDVRDVIETSTSKEFIGLRAGATYRIEIKAYKNDHSNTKSYSQPLTGSVTLIPEKPTNVQVPEANKAQTRLGVTWSAPANSELSAFVVYWKIDGSSDSFQNSDDITPGDSYKYDISSLTQGVTYYIEVKTKSSSELSDKTSTTATTSKYDGCITFQSF